MPGNYTITTRATGTVLTATIYNSDQQNHVDNQTPAGTDDQSVSVAAMQSVVDPGGVGTESLATSLQGELERLRFVLKGQSGEAQWYVAPTRTTLKDAAGTLVTNAFTKRQDWAKGADIASAAALTPGIDGNYFHVTGATTITSIASKQAGSLLLLEFDAALTLTHNATSLILPTGANITTAAGDTAVLVSEGAGNWRGVVYQKANGQSLASKSWNVIDQDAAVGTGSPADTIENTLKTFTVPAAILVTNGDTIYFEAGYRMAANATTKRVRVYFGATVLTDSSAVSSSGNTFIVRGVIIRTGATTQVAYVMVVGGANNGAWNAAITGTNSFTAPAETLSGTVVLKSTITLGVGAALNDVIQDYFIVAKLIQ